MADATFSLAAFQVSSTDPFVRKVLEAMVWNETSMVVHNAFSVYKNGDPSQGTMPSFGPVHFDPKYNPDGTAGFAAAVLRAGGNEALAAAIDRRPSKKVLTLTDADYAAINTALQTQAGRQAAIDQSVFQVEKLIGKARDVLQTEELKSNEALVALIADYGNKAGLDTVVSHEKAFMAKFLAGQQIEFTTVSDRFVFDASNPVESVVRFWMHQDTEFRAMPLVEGLADLDAGKLDAFIGLGPTRPRMEQYLFTQAPLFADQTILATSVNYPFAFNGDVSTLIGQHVFIMKGALHGDAFDNMSGIIHEPVDATREAFAKGFQEIIDGRRHFIVLNSLRATSEYLKKTGIFDNIKIYKDPIATRRFFVVMSKSASNGKDKVNRFNKLYRLFRSTRAYQRLIESLFEKGLSA